MSATSPLSVTTFKSFKFLHEVNPSYEKPSSSLASSVTIISNSSTLVKYLSTSIFFTVPGDEYLPFKTNFNSLMLVQFLKNQYFQNSYK